MDIKGRIVELEPTVNVTETFKKREFVVEYAENPTYPEFVKFELIQDRCAIMDQFKPNDEVVIHFNLKGRKWVDKQGQTKYFNSLQAWKVESASNSSGAGAPPPDMDFTPPPSDDDVLPF